jgi:integrase
MNEKIASLPRVVESNKGWYLYFLIRNPATGKMVARKVEKGFKSCLTIDEKRECGKKLAEEYTKKLRKGWTPWCNQESIYEDQIQYKNVSLSFGYKRKSRGTVDKYASDFLLFQKPSLKPKTYATYQSKLRIFCQWIDFNGFSDYDITAIDNKIILKFFAFLISERGLDKVTIRDYRIKMSRLFTYLMKEKILLQNPVFDIPIPRKKCDNAPKPILPDDLELISLEMSKNDPQLHLASMFQYFCAIRPGTELRLLKIKDIDFWTGKITISILNSKIERQDIIEIPKQLYKLITDVFHLQNYNKEFYVFSHGGIPGAKPLGVNSMRVRFNKFRDKLGLSKDYKFYSLKHTGASMLLESGATILDVMGHLRHSDIDSTYHYIRKRSGSGSDKIRNHFPSPYKSFDKKSE